MRQVVFNTRIRGAGLFGEQGRRTARMLCADEILVLKREPDNHVDGNAIIVLTFFGEECGYVARECAAKIAPLMDRGWLPYSHVRHRTPFIRVRFDLEEVEREINQRVDALCSNTSPVRVLDKTPSAVFSYYYGSLMNR